MDDEIPANTNTEQIISGLYFFLLIKFVVRIKLVKINSSLYSEQKNMLAAIKKLDSKLV